MNGALVCFPGPRAEALKHKRMIVGNSGPDRDSLCRLIRSNERARHNSQFHSPASPPFPIPILARAAVSLVSLAHVESVEFIVDPIVERLRCGLARAGAK